MHRLISVLAWVLVPLLGSCGSEARSRSSQEPSWEAIRPPVAVPGPPVVIPTLNSEGCK